MECNFRILLVDDDEINRFITSRVLRRLGFRMETACNGVAAIKELTRTHYDLILMDISMPVMDGIAATQYIRKNMVDSKRDTKIIALTGYCSDKEIMQCHDAGMNDHIFKPYSIDELLDKINVSERVRVA